MIGRINMFLQAGTRLAWLVDPETQTIAIFRQDAAPKTIGEGDTLDGGEIFPGFTVLVAEIFA